ncbi:protein LOW PSII ACCUMULATION 1, chloroplastic, partial [Henckelia pumila]|uniref:protein LOW PSII ACCUMULATION 1, chloroplastic n=1 Tax=Henckelia pumila TaxID=405737 RepID=UPI003C6E6E50
EPQDITTCGVFAVETTTVDFLSRCSVAQPAIAAAVRLSTLVTASPSCNPGNKCLGFSGQFTANVFSPAVASVNSTLCRRSRVICSASNGSSSSEISSTTRIHGEVLSLFRSLRMFFYLAFVASGSLGGFIAITQLIGALANSSRAAEVPEILKGIGIDFGTVSVFEFLYYQENNAKNAKLARLSREENLSNLKLRIDEKKILSLSSFRGVARLVILAGSASFIEESFKLSEPFTESLLERGVLLVPCASDETLPKFEFQETEETKEITAKRKRLWQLSPVLATEWATWLDEQKKLANVSPESSVYLSLRMDGRVRGSGVGYPPWNAFIAQLPPVKGIWSGLLDGMDGRVL